MYLKHIISEAEKWIAAYSSSFHNEDKEAMWGIGLKEAHIGFVRRNCKELAQWLKLTEHDVLLAELIGLLHDVGRFRQWSVYRTFRDNLIGQRLYFATSLILRIILPSFLPVSVTLSKSDGFTLNSFVIKFS